MIINEMTRYEFEGWKQIIFHEIFDFCLELGLYLKVIDVDRNDLMIKMSVRKIQNDELVGNFEAYYGIGRSRSYWINKIKNDILNKVNGDIDGPNMRLLLRKYIV